MEHYTFRFSPSRPLNSNTLEQVRNSARSWLGRPLGFPRPVDRLYIYKLVEVIEPAQAPIKITPAEEFKP